jgi:hypothetical protein
MQDAGQISLIHNPVHLLLQPSGVEPIPHDEPADFEIHEAPLGETVRPARIELAGLVLYLLSLAGFVVWLVVFGVNV